MKLPIKEKSKAKIYHENGNPFLKISPLYEEYGLSIKKMRSKKRENFSLRETAILNYILKNYPHLCYVNNEFMIEENLKQFKDVIDSFSLKKYYKKINNKHHNKQ